MQAARYQALQGAYAGTSMDSQDPSQQEGQADGEPKKSTRGRKKRTEPVKVTLENGESQMLTPKEYRSHRRCELLAVWRACVRVCACACACACVGKRRGEGGGGGPGAKHVSVGSWRGSARCSA